MTFTFDQPNRHGASIKVIGVGGAGCNAVNTMIAAELGSVDFIVANTDRQALDNNNSPQKIQIGDAITRGLGAGANPEIGRNSAMEDIEKIQQTMENADMVFVAAGMGGGTGTGAAPVIARAAKEMGALTVGVVTKPFKFEGKRRARIAEEGLRELRDHVDSLIVIPNEKLFKIAEKKTTLQDGFKMADAISDLINMPGLINLDFADVKTIMSDMGMAFMGMGIHSGDDRAAEAARKAISNPLLDDISIKGARGMLINVTGSSSLSFEDLEKATDFIREEAHEDANIIFGAAIDESMGDDFRITVIATGFSNEKAQLQSQGAHAIQPDAEQKAVSGLVANAAPVPAMELPDIKLPKTGQEAKVIKIGTIISEFGEDGEYDIPTFVRQQQVI